MRMFVYTPHCARVQPQVLAKKIHVANTRVARARLFLNVSKKPKGRRRVADARIMRARRLPSRNDEFTNINIGRSARTGKQGDVHAQVDKKHVIIFLFASVYI